MKKRTRNNSVNVYLSDKEKEILELKVKESKYHSYSDFIRDLIIYGFVYYIDYKYLRKYNYELGKIGTNINQIAHKVNETGNLYKSDVTELKKEMDEIWQLQKSMLSKQLYRQR